jgi:hypothetical protein
MKQSDSLAGRQTLFSLWAGRITSAGAAAVLALIAASGARADVVEKFNLSGNLNSIFGSPTAFTGTMDVDFSSDFGSYAVQSVEISVHGRSVFTQGPSVDLAASANAVIHASNNTNDMLTLMFTTPSAGTWDGFNQGAITGGWVIFGGLSGVLIGADGVISRDLSSPAIDPPIPIASAAVPELSTWAMMLVGLAGLGLAARRRRAFGVLRGRA